MATRPPRASASGSPPPGCVPHPGPRRVRSPRGGAARPLLEGGGPGRAPPDLRTRGAALHAPPGEPQPRNSIAVPAAVPPTGPDPPEPFASRALRGEPAPGRHGAFPRRNRRSPPALAAPPGRAGPAEGSPVPRRRVPAAAHGGQGQAEPRGGGARAPPPSPGCGKPVPLGGGARSRRPAPVPSPRPEPPPAPRPAFRHSRPRQSSRARLHFRAAGSPQPHFPELLPACWLLTGSASGGSSSRAN